MDEPWYTVFPGKDTTDDGQRGLACLHFAGSGERSRMILSGARGSLQLLVLLIILTISACGGGSGNGGGGITDQLALFAGNLAGPGTTDGTGAAARFLYPLGIATDSAGNVYVADNASHTIRKITPAGEVSTFAGTAGNPGSADGTGAAARFDFPVGLATDNADDVYVADTGNNTIRKITPAGVVSTLAGTAGYSGSADGTGGAARFYVPYGITVDNAGNVYVADNFNCAIRGITPNGEVSTIVGIPGQKGFDQGPLPGLLGEPVGVAMSGTSLYITIYNGVVVAHLLN
jgi:NHL repeat